MIMIVIVIVINIVIAINIVIHTIVRAIVIAPFPHNIEHPPETMVDAGMKSHIWYLGPQRGCLM